VNAAGAWADEVRRLRDAAASPLLSLVNGTHIVTGAFAGAPERAIYHEARADRRPFFVVPWRDLWLIGTTETPHVGDPDAVAPQPAEVAYLVRETNLLFPEARLTTDAVLYSYAGPRPLLRAMSANAQSMTREHGIYDHEKEEGVRGLVTLLGGKLTTARAFAALALGQIAAKLGRPAPRRKAIPARDSPAAPSRLRMIYGRQAEAIGALEKDQPGLQRRLCAANATTAAEIVHAVQREKARTLGDLLLRRTGAAFSPCLGLDCASEAARVAAPLLGWNDAAIDRAVQDYQQELDRTLVRGMRS
jgi:glycerol-3-phosphate dehydrogenase